MRGERGVVYLTWGERVEPFLRRSLASLRRHHPELPVHVVRLPDDPGPVAGLREKPRMAALSPFATTLYLDADTVVLGNLDYGFRQAERFDLACTICECPWARRYGGLAGDLVEYNTGVLFFTTRARPIFDAWQQLAREIDSSVGFVHEGQVRTMPWNDQASFARAVESAARPPAVLPLNWNLRPRWQRSFFGPVKVWHDYADVPADLYRINAYYDTPHAIIQYHAFGD